MPILWDLWGQGQDDGPLHYDVRRGFNHLPGGSNVLYLDGHVEFVKLGTRYPLRNGPAGTFGEDFEKYACLDVAIMDFGL